MDPEVMLAEIRETVAAIMAGGEADAVLYGRDLARRVEDLDGWLIRGGHLPAAWRGAEREDHR